MGLKSVYNKAKAAAPSVPIPSGLSPNKPLDILVGNVNKVTQRLGKAGADIGSGWDDIRHGRVIGTSAQEQDRMNQAGEETAGIQAANKQTEMLANLPQLQDRQGLGTLGDAGQFKASTIAQSPWAALAQKQQGLSQGMAGDALARSNAVAAAQGRALGGMQRGNAAQGLESAGIANQGQIASSRLGLAAQGGQQRQQIAQQGAGRGLDVAQFNVGQQNQAAQANVGAQNQDINQQNAFNRLKFGEQMKFKSGQETGNALDKSKGGKK